MSCNHRAVVAQRIVVLSYEQACPVITALTPSNGLRVISCQRDDSVIALLDHSSCQAKATCNTNFPQKNSFLGITCGT
eukprot:1153588-Pelagomonas_calceolata.AAC.1